MKKKKSFPDKFQPYTDIDFHYVDKKAKELADTIENRFEDLKNILLEYESSEVIKDETNRALDLLRNIKENRKYFRLRVGATTAFLPRNQPLYAFCCFIVVPSLMASEVHFCIPYAMRHFFKRMLDLLGASRMFPNIIISSKERLDFLRERSALLVNPKTKETRPLNDVVIFTGKSSNADKLRSVFDKQTLFIANGAGHNPVVVGKGANLPKAVEAITTLQFYNQGQDCAAPNSILVYKDLFFDFLKLLRSNVQQTKVGCYRDESCRIGPINDPNDLVRLENLLIENRGWIDPLTPGVIRSRESIIEPTIICKPLSEGGNFSEVFAPIIFIQKYEDDRNLSSYFEDPRYAPNAMYVTLYGESKYIKGLINKKICGKILHRRNTFLHNTHLHAPGVERGTRPYGGYGFGSSSISINDKIIAKPTLPQRDIYEYLVKPLLRKKTTGRQKKLSSRFIEVRKDVKKLLKLHLSNSEGKKQKLETTDNAYLDLNFVHKNSSRYLEVEEDKMYRLLGEPNIDCALILEPEDIRSIRKLRKLVDKKSMVSFGEFRSLLYDIPKKRNVAEKENKLYQRRFFKHVYQLLFGKDYGPQLAQFLFEVKDEKINNLLDV